MYTKQQKRSRKTYYMNKSVAMQHFSHAPQVSRESVFKKHPTLFKQLLAFLGSMKLKQKIIG